METAGVIESAAIPWKIRLRLLKLGEHGAAVCLNQFADELAGVDGPLGRLAAGDRLSEIISVYIETQHRVDAMEAAGTIEREMLGYGTFADLLRLGRHGAAACLHRFADEQASMDGSLDRRAARERLSKIMCSHLSMQTSIEEKFEAMETAGVIEPGAFTLKPRKRRRNKTLARLMRLGECDAVACLDRLADQQASVDGPLDIQKANHYLAHIMRSHSYSTRLPDSMRFEFTMGTDREWIVNDNIVTAETRIEEMEASGMIEPASFTLRMLRRLRTLGEHGAATCLDRFAELTDEQASMDGPLDRRAAYGRLARITNSYASIQTLIDEKIEAMETAGLLEPGAFTPKSRLRLLKLGEHGAAVCLHRFAEQQASEKNSSGGRWHFRPGASERRMVAILCNHDHRTSWQLLRQQGLSRRTATWLQKSNRSGALKSGEIPKEALEKLKELGDDSAVRCLQQYGRLVAWRRDSDRTMDHFVNFVVKEWENREASTPSVAEDTALSGLPLSDKVDVRVRAEQQQLTVTEAWVDAEAGEQLQAAEASWQPQSTADAESAAAKSQRTAADSDRQAAVTEALQQQILGRSHQPEVSGQTSILDKLFLQELANATDLNTLISFLTSGKVMLSFTKGGVGVVSVSPEDGTIEDYHLTACASRLVDLCHKMSPDELATFQRANRNSHRHATNGKGGVPPRFAWFLDQARLSALAGSSSDAMRNPDTLLAAFVAIGVEHQGLIADVADVAARSASVLSGAQLCNTLYNLAQLVPGHHDRIDQMRSAYDPAYHANAEVQRLHTSINRIAKALSFERVAQAPGNTIAKYLYAVSHLGVPRMEMDFQTWEKFLCDYRNKQVLKFDTAALTMLAQVYRTQGTVGTQKNPLAVFHTIAVQANDQRDQFLLPDIIKVLTAMTRLGADIKDQPGSGLNKFPGTVLATTYNERHAASNGGEVPATQHRASPLLEALLAEAARQLRDGRERLAASANMERRDMPTAVEPQAQARFESELFGMIEIVSKLRFHHEVLLEEIAAGFMQCHHASAPGESRASHDSILRLVAFFAEFNHGPTVFHGIGTGQEDRSSSGGAATDAFFELANDSLAGSVRIHDPNLEMPAHLRIDLASALLATGAIAPDALRGVVATMHPDTGSVRIRGPNGAYNAMQLITAHEANSANPTANLTPNHTMKPDEWSRKTRANGAYSMNLKRGLMRQLSEQTSAMEKDRSKGNRWEGTVFQRLQEVLNRNDLTGDIFIKRNYRVNSIYPVDFSFQTKQANFFNDRVALDRVALEYNGPNHYLWNSTLERGRRKLRNRLLELLGWTVIQVPYWEFESLKGHGGDEVDYLETKLATVLEAWRGKPIDSLATADAEFPAEDSGRSPGSPPPLDSCYNPDGTPRTVNGRYKTERVKLKGLAKHHTAADVVEFFAGGGLAIDTAAVSRKPGSWRATVTFADADEAQRAVLLDGGHIGERFMDLRQITKHEDDPALSETEAAAVAGVDAARPAQHISRRTVRLRNLPTNCTEDELSRTILAGFAIEPGTFERVRTFTANNKDCRIVFETAEEAQRAVEDRHMGFVRGQKVRLDIGELQEAFGSLSDLERGRRAAMDLEN